VKGNRDVYVMDASGGNLRAVVATSREEAAPYFQPDGMGLFYLVGSDSIFEIRRLQRDPSLWGAPKFMRKSGLIIPSPDNSKWVFSAPTGKHVLIVHSTCMSAHPMAAIFAAFS
jgi:hypothetical protein